MDYHWVLTGREKPIPVYEAILAVLQNIQCFPDLVEPIYREATGYDEETLDRLRFTLVRLQIHADIHRNEDLEKAMQVKYVAQILEKVIFGGMMLEPEEEHSAE
jgi:hypothetical protein